MKVTKFLAMLLCGLTMCFGFASCDDDEDGAGDGPGSGSFNVEGFTSGKLSYAYYRIGRGQCRIDLSNYAYKKVSNVSQLSADAAHLSIDFECSSNEIPTGTFDCWVAGGKYVDLKKGISHCFEAETNTKVTISKSGSSYNISVTGKTDFCEIDYNNGDREDEEISGSKKLTVNYKGKIEKFPVQTGDDFGDD